ncbi:MAG: flagellar export protein FliJ [Halorhodospira halophila]|uniref:flagellar export protein FliJ n=1 Tax=Halorhodospira TaxID=85108 RepID=UPI001912366B|nr:MULTISPECIES: flagellar export protein FliJ [Halorhodospira]MBK5942817.1 flagellar export protein FliJ [Halorhodospira halophila]MCC3751666.1 flagellar export protein FliJ [Halorhodospira halophila]MCG5528815.1 flagellar export protein FliJ [Halorhodospira halophila]MCG5534323.1 flagellar export protein FliJ [Halorhodospira sp. 9621]MCG5538682.1 flagellar export protein FliJ [Halorhodospira sp. 9622]
MSKGAERLRPVERLTDQRKEQAASQLARAEGELRQGEARLEEILEMRQEYRRQLTQDNAIEAARLRDFNAFLTRLDEAIVQQRQQIAQQQRRVTQLHKEWLRRWGEHRTIEKVVERRAEAEQAAAERRERQESDEVARMLYQAIQRGDLPGQGG